MQAEARLVAEDTELAGVGLKRGDCVILILGSANHDESVFAGADSIHLTRSPSPHLGFGRCAHSCLGAGISLLQAKVVLPRIFAACEPSGFNDRLGRRALKAWVRTDISSRYQE